MAIAAMLVGDKHVNVPWSPNLEHYLQGLYEASNSAGLVTSDEIIKLSTAKGGDVLVGLNALLTFTQGSLVRKLYTGPVSVGQVPAIVLTDIAFPRELLCDEQLGRRHVHVHLGRKVDWQHTAKDIHRWRMRNPEHADAANAIVSSVIDAYFAGDEPLPFEDIARDLGFGLLNEGGDIGLDPKDELLTLFRLCCSGKAIAAPETTWKGRSWKYIKRDGADVLSQHWQHVCDNLNDGFVSSRRVKETDWAQLLGVTDAVECDLAPNGKSALAIRFRCGLPRAKDLKVNEEIVVSGSSKVVHATSGESGEAPPAPPPRADHPPPDEPPSNPPPNNPTPGPVAPPPSSPAGAATNGLEDFLNGAPGRVASVERPVNSPTSTPPVFIDVETRSACDLKKVGGRMYARHSSTEIMTFVALIDQTVVAWAPLLNEPLPADELWPSGFGPRRYAVESYAGPSIPPSLADAIKAGRPLCAHNALGFDKFIWQAKQLPEPAAWLDTLPHARAAGLPGQLDLLGERLLGQGKDKEGAAILKRLCRPNHRGEFLPFSRQSGIKLMCYNIADVLLLTRIHEVAYGHAEPDVLALDAVVNNRGVQFDGTLARSLIELENHETKAVGRNVEQLTGGAIKATDLRRDKLLKSYLEGRSLHLTNLKRETIHNLLNNGASLDPVALAVLEARLAVNRVTTGKLHAAQLAQDTDGRLRDTLVYHKALTGRWSSKGVQLHNLPRPHKNLKDIFPLLDLVNDPQAFRAALPPNVSVADAISALIRPTIRAAEGKKLCMGDFASIEARGVAWCAGDQTLLDRYGRGEDVYCGLATHIFGRTITKKDDAERQIGKQGILGCGYGMGADTFGQRCTDLGIDLAAAHTTAAAVVEGYRNAYPKIAGVKVSSNGHTWRQGGLWKDLEAAAQNALFNGVPQRAGHCVFLRDGGSLLIELPSGRRLCYRNARIEYAVPGYCARLGLPAKQKPTILFDHPKEGTKQAYGGMLTENVVQALCRDLLVAAMLECERQGLPVVLHVHDEIVIEVPAGEADEALRKLVTIMSAPPPWAAGFPIEVEGFASERYSKVPPPGAKAIKARDGKVQ